MKKELLFLFTLLALLISSIAVLADFNAQKGFDWLVNQAVGGSYGNDIITTTFATLALKQIGAVTKSDEGFDWIMSQKTAQNCWPKPSCRTKHTAFALLTSYEFNEDISDGINWLTDSQNSWLTGNWLLQVVTSNTGTCRIYYKDKERIISVDKGKFPDCGGTTFLDLNGNCLDPNLILNNPSIELDIRCNMDVSVIQIIYKSSSTYYLYDNAYASNFIVKINNGCFGTYYKGSCDYYTTLYVNWILKELNKQNDLNSLLWLKLSPGYDRSNTEHNALLYLITGETHYLDVLKSQQIPGGSNAGSWNRDPYDTALAIIALKKAGSLQEVENAIEWLKSNQDDRGCWPKNNCNLLDTAIVLYSSFTEETVECYTGDTRDCPKQEGVCDSSYESCINNQFLGCTDDTYLNFNPNYEEEETSCDDLDNDCDGSIDEGCECVPGEERDCPKQEGVCADSSETCASDGTWPGCDYYSISNYETTEESCNDNKDNDCDGYADCEDEEDCGGDFDGDGICDPIDNDKDGDGVPNNYDQEEWTPIGCLVDLNTGIKIDTDNDGICNGLDKCNGTLTTCVADEDGCPLNCDTAGCVGDPYCKCESCDDCFNVYGWVCSLEECATCAIGNCYLKDQGLWKRSTCESCTLITDCPVYDLEENCIDNPCIDQIGTNCSWVNDSCCNDNDLDSICNEDDICPNDPTQTCTNQTCAEQNGDICTENETCPGDDWIRAKDTDRCCKWNCTTATQTCFEQGGYICIGEEICPGEMLNATDTQRCCSEECIIPPECEIGGDCITIENCPGEYDEYCDCIDIPDDDCPSEEGCTPADECQYDYDCPIDEECDLDTCICVSIAVGCTPADECQYDYDCAIDEECDLDTCICVSITGCTPMDECQYDYDCPEDEECDLDTCTCEPITPIGCTEADECRADYDCPTGQVCNLDICICEEIPVEKKGFPWWIIILIAALAIGGYFFYIKFVKAPPKGKGPFGLGGRMPPKRPGYPLTGEIKIPEKPKPSLFGRPKPEQAAPLQPPRRRKPIITRIEEELDKSIREAKKLLRRK